jgi:hypothetical protein
VPYRRTGGHTGPYGFASFAGPGVVAGDYGVVSSFDVAPTILELATGNASSEISGTSLAEQFLQRTASST